MMRRARVQRADASPQVPIWCVVALGMAAVGCSRGPDTSALDIVRAAVLAVDLGELYLSVDEDGRCTTDCPTPGISRGYVVDCDSLEALATQYEAILAERGFTNVGAGEWETDAGDERVIASVLTYDDASQGPQPTENPFQRDPSRLADACSIVILGTIK